MSLPHSTNNGKKAHYHGMTFVQWETLCMKIKSNSFLNLFCASLTMEILLIFGGIVG